MHHIVSSVTLGDFGAADDTISAESEEWELMKGELTGGGSARAPLCQTNAVATQNVFPFTDSKLWGTNLL